MEPRFQSSFVVTKNSQLKKNYSSCLKLYNLSLPFHNDCKGLIKFHFDFFLGLLIQIFIKKKLKKTSKSDWTPDGIRTEKISRFPE